MEISQLVAQQERKRHPRVGATDHPFWKFWTFRSSNSLVFLTGTLEEDWSP
jgi:hypothetical protein